MSNMSELVKQDDHFSLERFPVPGGWLYVARMFANGGSHAADSLAVSTTFVPEPPSV